MEADTPDDQYTYMKLLDHGLPEPIRLLQLDLSSEDDSLIEGSLQNHPLHVSFDIVGARRYVPFDKKSPQMAARDSTHINFRCIEYYALSYAWGESYDDNSHLTHHILIDGKQLKVTATLHSALVRMRQYIKKTATKRHMRLWVDAICINQADIEERNRQVLRMDSIFASAVQVVVWLGDPSDAEEHRKITRLDRAIQTLYTSDSRENLVETSTEPTTVKSTMMSLMLERRWFHRRWVIQEVAKARDCTIFLGECVWDAVRFTELALLLGMQAEPFFRYGYGGRLTTSKETAVGLLHLLNRFDSAQCQDPKDRIYALQGCEDKAIVEPNYSSSVEEVYTRFAGALARRGYVDLLLIAAACRNQTSPILDHTLPSWVPDWRKRVPPNIVQSSLWGVVLKLDQIERRFIGEFVGGSSCRRYEEKILEVRGWLVSNCSHTVNTRQRRLLREVAGVFENDGLLQVFRRFPDSRVLLRKLPLPSHYVAFVLQHCVTRSKDVFYRLISVQELKCSDAEDDCTNKLGAQSWIGIH